VCAARGHLEGDKLDVNVGLLPAWSYASFVVGLLLAVCAALLKRQPQVRAAALGLQLPQAALGVMMAFLINPALGVMQVLIVLIVLQRLLRSEGRPSTHEGSLQG
jgi:hypothetical protein